MVFCKVGCCPYNENQEYCRKRSNSLDKSGRCTQIWGGQGLKDKRAIEPVGEEFKLDIEILEAESRTVQEEEVYEQLSFLDE